MWLEYRDQGVEWEEMRAGRGWAQQDLEFCSGRWEPLRVLSQGGAWSDSGVHRRALAPRDCNRRNQETGTEAIRLVEYLNHLVPRS